MGYSEEEGIEYLVLSTETVKTEVPFTYLNVKGTSVLFYCLETSNYYLATYFIVVLALSTPYYYTFSA